MLFSDLVDLRLGVHPVQRAYLGSKAAWARSAHGAAPMPIGGGGWVTGISVSQDAMYVRTDVGGAYRFDAREGRWVQLITSGGVPSSSRSPSDYQVEALAAAPSAPDVVYAAVGSGDGGRVIRSTDAGATWRDASTRRFFIAGNATERVSGCRIAIDPYNPAEVYLGTRLDGMWKSSDGGTTWSNVTSVPSAVNDRESHDAVGISCIAIDRFSPIQGGAHTGVVAAVFGVGLLRSDDGGRTWHVVAPWSGANAYVRDLVQSSTGDMYAAMYAPGPSAGRVIRVRRDGNVADISPKGQPWTSIAVDPAKPNVVYAAPDAITKYHSYYRTANASALKPSWTAITAFDFADADGSQESWLVTQVMPSDDPYMWVGQIRFHGPRIVLAEGRGVWQSSPSPTNRITLINTSVGIEEMVANRVIRPRGHPPLTCQWDYGFLRHGDRPELPYRTTFGSGWDVAVSPTDPDFVVVLMDDHQDLTGRSHPARRASGYCHDGGANVQRFEALANGTAPSDMLFGNLAVSAHNSSNIVWLPSNLTGRDCRVYTSRDMGATWIAASLQGLSYDDVLHPRYTFARRVLVSDPHTPGKFFILGHKASSGYPILWRSVDAGLTWRATEMTGISGSYRYNSTLKHDGTRLWAAPGDGGPGLFHSADGAVWTQARSLRKAQGVAIGAPMPGTSTPSVYTYGEVAGRSGIYRTVDLGISWQFIVDHPGGLYAGIRDLEADTVIPGRLYVACAEGLGFVRIDNT